MRTRMRDPSVDYPDRVVGDIDARYRMYVAISREIRAARLRSGLRQWQLAAMIGVSRQMLHQYETVRSFVPIDALLRIAEATDTPIETLCSRVKVALFDATPPPSYRPPGRPRAKKDQGPPGGP